MKTCALAIMVVTLLSTGCTSAPKGAYALTPRAQIVDRMHANARSPTEAWNHWKYAGSDDDYDYVYEYDRGDMYPNDFHFYKTARGELHLPYFHPFDANFNTNEIISN